MSENKPDLMAELAEVDRRAKEATLASDAKAMIAIAFDALDIVHLRHAELEAVVRKAARYDWLRAIGEPEAEIMFRAQMYAGTPPDLMDEAIDEQMHNSAREGL